MGNVDMIETRSLSLRCRAVEALIGLLSIGVSTATFADSPANGVSGVVFFGAGVSNEYEGSEDFEPLPLVGGRLQYEGYYAQTIGTGVKVNVVNSRRFNFGPVLNYRFGRDDDVENNAVARLDEVDDSFEAGLFARMNFRPNTTTRHRAGIEASFRQDISDGHEGFLFTIGADYSTPIGERGDLGVDLSTTYASDDYMQSFFGVNAAGSARSGLRRFDAEGGFKDVSLAISPSYAFTESWGLFGRFQYSELLGDASDSPVVDDAGDSSQFFAGLGVSYRF